MPDPSRESAIQQEFGSNVIHRVLGPLTPVVSLPHTLPWWSVSAFWPDAIQMEEGRNILKLMNSSPEELLHCLLSLFGPAGITSLGYPHGPQSKQEVKWMSQLEKKYESTMWICDRRGEGGEKRAAVKTYFGNSKSHPLAWQLLSRPNKASFTLERSSHCGHRAGNKEIRICVCELVVWFLSHIGMVDGHKQSKSTHISSKMGVQAGETAPRREWWGLIALEPCERVVCM